MNNLGIAVKIRFSDGCPLQGLEDTLRNVSEIHYNYRPGRIAFESDLHGTGITYDVSWISEFETRPEESIADEF